MENDAPTAASSGAATPGGRVAQEGPAYRSGDSPAYRSDDAAGYSADAGDGYRTEDRRPGVDGDGDWAGGRRLFGVLTGLLQIHVEIAQQEARRDQQRLVRAVVCFVIAGFLGLIVLLLLQGLALAGLHRLGLSWTLALAALCGGDLLLSLVLALVGRSALRDPVLPQTRALLRRTLTALMGR